MIWQIVLPSQVEEVSFSLTIPAWRTGVMATLKCRENVLGFLHSRSRRIDYEEIHRTLTKGEREVPGSLVSKGKQQSQKILNAPISLDCDSGDYQTSRSTNEEIARVLNLNMRKIDRRGAAAGSGLARAIGKAGLSVSPHRSMQYFLACEPLAGKRLVMITERKTKRDEGVPLRDPSQENLNRQGRCCL